MQSASVQQSATQFNLSLKAFLNNQFAMSGLVLTPSNSQETLIKNGWFSETEAMWPGKIKVEDRSCIFTI